MPGHKNFRPGTSTLNVPPDWIEKFIGRGSPANNFPPGTAGYREVVNFGRVIGNYCTENDPVGVPTKNGIFHWSYSGMHLVPSAP